MVELNKDSDDIDVALAAWRLRQHEILEGEPVPDTEPRCLLVRLREGYEERLPERWTPEGGRK